MKVRRIKLRPSVTFGSPEDTPKAIVRAMAQYVLRDMVEGQLDNLNDEKTVRFGLPLYLHDDDDGDGTGLHDHILDRVRHRLEDFFYGPTKDMRGFLNTYYPLIENNTLLDKFVDGTREYKNMVPLPRNSYPSVHVRRLPGTRMGEICLFEDVTSFDRTGTMPREIRERTVPADSLYVLGVPQRAERFSLLVGHEPAGVVPNEELARDGAVRLRRSRAGFYIFDDPREAETLLFSKFDDIAHICEAQDFLDRTKYPFGFYISINGPFSDLETGPTFRVVVTAEPWTDARATVLETITV